MQEITLIVGENDWKVAEFIWKNGGVMIEFDGEVFSIFTDTDKPRLRFRNGDTIYFKNNCFSIR